MFTLLIQGKIEESCVNQNIKNFNVKMPIVISTWNDQKFDFEFPNRVSIILNETPNNPGIHNFMCQLISTIEGCKLVETKYVIKVRGDEFFNYEKIMLEVEKNEDLIHCSPVFFRSFSHWPYHISDHMIAGRTDYLTSMFEESKIKYEKKMNHDDAKEWGLTKAHLRNMGFFDFENHLLGKEEMKKRFGIIKMNDLKPYRVTVNMFGKIFFDNFVPSEWGSIEEINNI